MNFQDGLQQISKDVELSGQPTRVLLYIMSQMGATNRIDLTQGEIAEALDIHPSRVSDAIKKLTTKGILIKHSGRGRAWLYELDSLYLWQSDLAEKT